jgi:hypothetical protein
MGHNHSINQAFGFTLTPFIERHIVAAALKVPIRFKNHGRLEAAMIRAVDPVLACDPSGYAYNFARDSPLARRLKDYATYCGHRHCAATASA